MSVLRGLMLVVIWAATTRLSREFGEGLFALVVAVAVMGAWAVGMWDEASRSTDDESLDKSDGVR